MTTSLFRGAPKSTVHQAHIARRLGGSVFGEDVGDDYCPRVRGLEPLAQLVSIPQTGMRQLGWSARAVIGRLPLLQHGSRDRLRQAVEPSRRALENEIVVTGANGPSNVSAMRRVWRLTGAAVVSTFVVACGGPLTHVATDPRWLDPFTGRASVPVAARTSAEPVRVAVYGDVRGEREKHRAVVEAIRAARPDLVVFTGDALRCYPVGHMPDFGLATYLLPFWPQVQRGYPVVMLASLVPFPALIHETIGRPFAPPRDADGWNGFLADTAPLRLSDRVPFVFVPGNHDEYHQADRRELARLFVSNETPDRGDVGLFFSVEIGGYRVHALDTGDDLFGDLDPIDAGGRQLKWLEASLADADAKGLRSIVAMHLPAYSSTAEDEPSPTVRTRIAEEILDKHDIALVVAGHSHAYERLEHPGRGGHAVTHIITGGGGAPFHHEAAPATRDAGTKVFVEGTTHFVLLELAADEVRGRMVPVAGAGKSDSFVARRGQISARSP